MDKQIANKPVDTGAKAKLFADGMRVHTLADTKGLTYAEMPRFLDENGKPTALREPFAPRLPRGVGRFRG